MSTVVSALKRISFTSIFGKLSEWTRFERIWLTTFTAINIFLFFAFDDTILGLIASLSGMMCVVLVAKGKISNYFFGLIQVAAYGYLALTYNLYGEVLLNWGFYVPVQFAGLYLWNKHAAKASDPGDVQVKFLSKTQLAALILGTVGAIGIFAAFLHYLGGASIGLDSATTILSIAAQFLMLARYAEQWIMWIVINILSITMWAITLYSTGGNDWTLVVMWSAFLFNSVYGYINWRKMGKAQAKEGAHV